MTEVVRRSHLQDYAHEMIAKHGPRSAGMIWAQFVNVLGNVVPGVPAAASVADQIAGIEEELKKDSRLRFIDPDPTDRQGGWFEHIPDEEDEQ